MTIYIVHNSPINLEGIPKTDAFFIFIDETTRKGKKEGYLLKSDWGAKLSPFILCMEGDKPVKAFYSEADDNIIQSLINYLNE